MIAIFILLSCVTLVRNKTLLINEYVRDDAIDILAVTETYMLSFRNTKIVDLYVYRISENRAFIRKSKGLGKSGFYA